MGDRKLKTTLYSLLTTPCLEQPPLWINVEVDKSQKAFYRAADGIGSAALRAVEVGDAGRGVIHQEVVARDVNIGRVVWRESYRLVSLCHDALEATLPRHRKAPLHTLERDNGHNAQARQLSAQRERNLGSFDIETECHTAQKVAVAQGVQLPNRTLQLGVATAIVGAMTGKTCGYVSVVGDSF